MKPKILLAGSGAIGGIISAVLAKNGHDIMMQTNHPEVKTLCTKEGIRILGYLGDFKQKINTVLPSDLLNEKFDIVLIATKATDLIETSTKLLPHIKEDSLVVSLQNGICEDALSEIVGANRTVGCVVGWGATMIDRGTLEMTSGGFNTIGSINGIEKSQLEPLRNILNDVVPTHISGNIYGSLYSKLIINSCITTLGAISGLKLGKMLAKKKIRNIFIEIMREAMAVAKAMELEVEPYLGKIDYYKFLEKDTFFLRLKQHFIIRVIGFRFRKLKSSSLQSLERGKPTEIDFFNGYIAGKAKKFNVPAPVNESVVRIVKEIEAGTKQSTTDNFKLPVFDRF